MVERFKIRKEKNSKITGSFAGGSFCKECGEYSAGCSGVSYADGNTHITYGNIQIIDGICNLCVEDLK